MYYPKSQIQTDLYTNGNEFYLLSTGESYEGYYHIVGGSLFYTGKNPNDTPIKSLILDLPASPEDTDGVFPKDQIVVQNRSYESFKVGNEQNNLIYSITPKNSNSSNRFLPPYSSPIPTPSDYELGEFQRYFCKKNNELIYIEINIQTYQDLIDQSPTISFELYTPISIPWSLTGDREQVYNTNKKIVSLKEQKQKFYGFSSYFKDDFSKYYLES